MPEVDPMSTAFVFGVSELKAVMLATAIIATIAAVRYRRSPASGAGTDTVGSRVDAPRG